MISALFYLQLHSVVNRTLARLRRLRQPKYLLGGIVGAIYFYFYFLRYAFSTGKGAQFPGAAAIDPFLIELIAASVLGFILLLAWMVPHQRAALAFSEAEVAFLFPAPISRKGLIHFKLLRSQSAIIFSVFIFTLIFNRFGGKAWIHAVGWWIILSTINLHLLGSSFGRSMLLDRGISNWQRRLIILTLLALVAGAVLVWARRTIPAFELGQFASWESAKEYLQRLFSSGPLPYVLYPFRLVVRPMVASSAAGFLIVLAPALLLLVAHYAWVIRCDVGFEEASVDASKKLAEKVAAIRSGNWQRGGAKHKPRRAPFRLLPTGPPAVAIFWKNLISTGQAITLRTWIILAVAATIFCSSAGPAFGRSNVAMVVAMLSAMFIIWSLMLGPQLLRQDFRQDLPLADVLKSLPMRSWQVALGELLAPAVVLTAIHWLLLGIGLVCFLQSSDTNIPRALIIGIAIGATLLLPMLNLLVMQIPNAAVLLFPAWFQTGKDAPQGVEATGQRLILIFAQMLAFLIALIPAVGIFALLFFLVKMLAGPILAIPMAAAAAAVVLAVEAGCGVLLLGKLFERFDVSEES